MTKLQDRKGIKVGLLHNFNLLLCSVPIKCSTTHRHGCFCLPPSLPPLCLRTVSPSLIVIRQRTAGHKVNNNNTSLRLSGVQLRVFNVYVCVCLREDKNAFFAFSDEWRSSWKQLSPAGLRPIRPKHLTCSKTVKTSPVSRTWNDF